MCIMRAARGAIAALRITIKGTGSVYVVDRSLTIHLFWGTLND